jgi:sulfite reductase alpha subunit-like flavoprotein
MLEGPSDIRISPLATPAAYSAIQNPADLLYMSIDEEPLSICFFYGSQTGTAVDYATSLFQLARRCHAHATLVNLADADALIRLAESEYAVFCIATAGTGEFPASMQTFWQTLMRDSLDDSSLLEDCSFAVLGLGDTKYPLFNYAAKKLRRRLLKLGGHEFLPPGLADESNPEHGLDAVVDPWQQELKIFLTAQIDKEPMDETTLLPPVNLIEIAQDGLSVAHHEEMTPARVLRNHRFTPVAHWQDIREFHLAVPTDNISSITSAKIEPGDVLCLMPVNETEDVDRFLALMHWKEAADVPITIEPPLDLSCAHAETPLTLRKLAKFVLPLTGVPRPSLFAGLKHFCTDDAFREKFMEWETLEGKYDYYDYINRPRRNLLEVLDDFAHGLDVPWRYALDLFGTMAPREYSIAGAKQLDDKTWQVECLIALVHYQTRIKQPRVGVASRYIKSLKENDSVSANVRKNPMPRATGPAICIGPGTGFAPLRFLLQQGWAQPGSTALLFGCRGKDDDLTRTIDFKEPLQHSWVAHSREGVKTYVQWLMRDDPDVRSAVKSLLNDGAIVYLSGSSGKMPEGVKEVICEIMDDPDTVTKLARSGRWWEETW